MSDSTPNIELSLKDIFVNFFKTFQTPEGEYKYRSRIAQMPIYGSKSLEIDFDDLLSYDKEVASRLINDPKSVIEEASEAIREVMQVENREYAETIEKFTARFKGVPNSVPLRGIRSTHINKLIVVEGIVTRISPVKQQLVVAVFRCRNCGEEVLVPQGEEGLTPPTMCPKCSEERRRPSFKLVAEKSKFIDWQKLVLQERPEELPPGQLPRSIEVVLKEDLVDVVRPGDRAVITGVLRVRRERTLGKEGAPIFKVFLEANHVEVSSKEAYDIEITPEDEKIILELSKDPYIRDKIIASIAPSIHGYEKIKEAIACLLFGGEPKVFPDGVRVRGDIHVLLVGDPGVGKSQILRYVASIAPRGIYTTGKGSTAAGLTAAVVREKRSGDFYLEAGALVLADGGVACLHPKTKVLANGKFIEIQKLFDVRNAVKVTLSNGEVAELCNSTYRVIGLDEKATLVSAIATLVMRKWWRGYLLKICFSNGSKIFVTPDHLLINGEDKSWREAREFDVGSHTILVHNSSKFMSVPKLAIQTGLVTSIEEVPYEGYVYDLYVPGIHDFVAEGVVVHNCIDEFDKMDPRDRVSIHEAMEQQTISIAKAGIVATLNARTSILAAANPAFGRYLRYRTIAENIDLPATILSRFDLIFVITDVPSAEEDKRLATHVVELHSGDYHTTFKSVIPPQLLRKYIAYARKYVHPKLTEEAKSKIIQFYTEMRAKSENPNSPITITPRQLEALIRLAEAHAKMALSDVVNEKDAEAAIELMMYFLQSVGLDVETETIDIDIVMTGKPMSQREKLIKLIDIMREMEERSKDGLVKMSELIDEATSQGLDKEFVERALDHLRREGEIYEPKPGFLKRT